MPNYQKYIVIGHATRDTQLRYTNNQQAVCDFGIATSRKYKTAAGEQREDTCFIDCTAWGKLGEIINQYVRKGSPIFLSGYLKLDQWEDKKDGSKRSKIGMVVEDMQLLGGKRDDGGDPAQESAKPSIKTEVKRRAAQKQVTEQEALGGPGVDPDSIPF